MSSLLRRCLSSLVCERYVCVVGSGPAGFYAAKYLSEQRTVDGLSVRVDILEQLPVPFGLVRYGVAPDHPEVKSVESTFTKVASSQSVRFFGNVRVGEGGAVTVPELQRAYDAVVLACGAEEDRSLGLDGEKSFTNIVSARAFVRWYNGHPTSYEDTSAASIGALVRKARHIVIVGNGNVALDCARVLAKNPHDLASTDITQDALEALSDAQVSVPRRSLSVVGRRGAAQAAFTIKELREILKLPNARLQIHSDEWAASMTEASQQEILNSRPRTRLVELMQSAVMDNLDINKDKDKDKDKEKDKGKDEDKAGSMDIALRFLLRPTKLEANPLNPKEAFHVCFTRCELQGPPEFQRASDVSPATTLRLPCDLLISSVGYRSTPVDGVSWDPVTCTIPNVAGRVINNSSVSSGSGRLYVTGWLKRGPTGIIASAVGDAKETAASVLSDLQQMSTCSPSHGGADKDKNKDKVQEDASPPRVDPATSLACLSSGPVVTWAGFGRIDKAERERGALLSPAKPRDKVLTTTEMLRLANSALKD